MTNDEGFIEWLNEHRDETSITGYVDETLAHFSFVAGCKWKDAQFKEYLEKKKAEIEQGVYHSSPLIDGDRWCGRADVISEIINELFGGE